MVAAGSGGMATGRVKVVMEVMVVAGAWVEAGKVLVVVRGV